MNYNDIEINTYLELRCILWNITRYKWMWSKLYRIYLKPIFSTLQIPLVALEIWGTGYEGEDIDEGSADSPPIFLLSMTKDHLQNMDPARNFGTLNSLAFNFSCISCHWCRNRCALIPLHPAVEICRVNRYMAIQISIMSFHVPYSYQPIEHEVFQSFFARSAGDTSFSAGFAFHNGGSSIWRCSTCK